MVGDRQWVAGGELGGGERSAQDLKQIILNILQEGETVTKALKRLKPVSKRATGKRKTRSTAKQADTAANDEDAQDQAEKENEFSQLTEVAGELMNLGFEDIYQDPKAKIAATLTETAEGNANRGGVVWHDDGTVKDDAAKEHTMYQRNNVDSALTFKESEDTAKASSLDTDKAKSQIPVPATSTTPDADQASLTAAQEAGTTASDPATELADAPASDHTAAVQADGNQPAAHAVKGSDSDPQEAVGADAVDTQSNQAGSLTELEAEDQEAGATNQAAVSQHAGHPQSNSGGTAADAATDGVVSASAVDVQAGASDHATVDAMDTAPTIEQQPNATTGSADTAADTAAAAVATADVPLATDDSTQQPATDTTAATTTANPTDAAATESAATGTSAAATGDTVANSWRGTGKGPGLGQSQEFSGGPMNLARPKYRHAPYNLPPARGGERFGLGNTWSPRGRGSPRGGFVSAPGRGFSNPVGSNTMRPQYRQQPPPPQGHPGYGQPPPYAYPPQPPPSAYYPPPQQQFQQQYPPPYPPPQQAFAAQYAQAPYTPPPPYNGTSTYPAPPPAQPPPYDPQWQNQAQGQYASYQQPAAYPGAPPA